MPKKKPRDPRRYVYPFELIRTIDGDSFKVMQDKGNDIFFLITLRLMGCDTPELRKLEQRNAAHTVRSAVNRLLYASDGLHCTSEKWDKYGGRVDGDVQFIPPWSKRAHWLSAFLVVNHLAKIYTGKGKRTWNARELKTAHRAAEKLTERVDETTH